MPIFRFFQTLAPLILLGSAARAEVKWIPVESDASAQRLAQATPKVDYMRQVHPLLQENCGGCHLNGKAKGGLRLDTREEILKGGISGPAAIAGDGNNSLLIKLV